MVMSRSKKLTYVGNVKKDGIEYIEVYRNIGGKVLRISTIHILMKPNQQYGFYMMLSCCEILQDTFYVNTIEEDAQVLYIFRPHQWKLRQKISVKTTERKLERSYFSRSF